MATAEELAAAQEAEEDKLFAEAAAASNAKRGIKPGDPADDDGNDDGEDGAAATTTTKSTGTAPATTTAAPATEKTQPSAVKAQTPAATDQGDIWATATPEQRAALRNLQAAEGRVPNLQRENAELQRQLTEARTQKPPAPSSGEDGSTEPKKPSKAKTIKEDDRFKQLAEDYPDFAPLVDGLAGLQEVVEETRGGVAGLAQVRHRQVVEENIKTVEKAIPEWLELTGQPAFVDWLGTKSKSFQDMAVRNGTEIVDPVEAIDVIGAYRTHLISEAARAGAAPPNSGSGAPHQPSVDLKARREAQLAGARSPSTNRSPTATPPASADAEEDAIWNEMVAKVEKRKRA